MSDQSRTERGSSDRLLTMIMKRLDVSAAEEKVTTDKYHALEIEVTKLKGHVARALREVAALAKLIKDTDDGKNKATAATETQARTALWQKLGIAAMSLAALLAAIAANIGNAS